MIEITKDNESIAVVADIDFFLKEPQEDIFIFPFGQLNTKVLNYLSNRLMAFYAGLNYEIKIAIERSQPLDEAYRIGEFYDANYFITAMNFINALRKVPGKINVGITEVGVFDGEESHPLFGVGGYDSGIISTYRFRIKKMARRS